MFPMKTAGKKAPPFAAKGAAKKGAPAGKMCPGCKNPGCKKAGKCMKAKG